VSVPTPLQVSREPEETPELIKQNSRGKTDKMRALPAPVCAIGLLGKRYVSGPIEEGTK